MVRATVSHPCQIAQRAERLAGWALADHIRAELVCDALRMTIAQRRPTPGLIFHSDRGTQYTSSEFTALLAEQPAK